MRVDEVLADFDGFMSSEDHVEFYWVPNTGWALTKRNRRTDEPAGPAPRVREWRDDVALRQRRLRRDVPARPPASPQWIPRLAKALPSTGPLDYVDRSDRVFTSPRHVRFYEMEYAIPREAVPEALNRVRRLVDESGLQLSFPVEVRVVAGRRHPAVDRLRAGHRLHRRPRVPGDAVRRVLPGRRADHGQLRAAGRTGGRCTSSGPRPSLRAYPRWGEFAVLRRRIDPDGRFANPYLDARPRPPADHGLWLYDHYTVNSARRRFGANPDTNTTLCGRPTLGASFERNITLRGGPDTERNML